MKGKSHIIVNACLAVLTENAFHLAGVPLHWNNLELRLTYGSSSLALEISKGVYYGCALLAARLPDADLRLPFGRHRGFTHSFLGGLILALALLAAGLLALFFFLQEGITVSQDSISIGGLAIVSLTLGCFYHMLADALTISGIAFLWPSKIRIRLLPAVYSLRTGKNAEYLVVAVAAFVVGLLLWLNLLGI